MQSQRPRDTAPELALRRELHALGLRYRVDVSPVAGMRSRADVVFASARIAVFVDGCFWHSCQVHASIPKSNRQWWTDKLDANVARDARVDQELIAQGWKPVRIWEHDDMCDAARRIAQQVRKRATAAASRSAPR